MPTDPYYAHMLSRRPSSFRRINMYRKDDIFAYSTSCQFKDLLRTLISTEGATEATRQDLQRNPYFDPNVAFRICDYNASGYVSKDELRYLMESRGLFVSDAEVREVAKKLDTNMDGVITHNEFVDSVRPKSPTRRM